MIFDELIVSLLVMEVEWLFELVDVLCCDGVVILLVLYWFGDLCCIVDCVVIVCDGWIVVDLVVLIDFDVVVEMMIGWLLLCMCVVVLEWVVLVEFGFGLGFSVW